MIEFVKKYAWIIVLVISLIGGFLLRGLFILDSSKDDVKEWKNKVELLEKQHKIDSIANKRVNDSLIGMIDIQTQQIYNTQIQYESIKKKYNDLRNVMRNYDAKHVVKFWTDQTNVSNDW